MYLEALKLQKQAQTSVSDDYKQIFTQTLPLDIFIYIFSFVPLNSLLKLMRVNKVRLFWR